MTPFEVVGRLAPSPTGALHLGNARSFLLAWLSVRSRGGALLCRVEDLDGPRTKEGAAEQAIDELSWLGLDWDGEAQLQSLRLPRFEVALDHLRRKGLVYPCVCTRSEIERSQSAPQEALDHGTRYPGTCRGRFASAEEARAATGREPAWRFRVPDGRFVEWDDLVQGPQAIDVSADSGDFVVAKKDGQPAYQLAVVVDDGDFAINEVLRGDDLLSSTPRQILLYEALGMPLPSFAHVPLVLGADGRRLAKRHGDSRIATYRRRGVEAEEILGFLAWTLGLQEEPRPKAAAEFLEGFDLAALPKTPYRFELAPWER
ncbi:MAG: tRNA glutamyl-Q(34) synthetase GluQRS [Planctomycetota bacterium]|nr:MAG: tRNA glutamyl-Q(34) synthetase GluQRS [Planctomycetota bacterium]